MLTRRVTHVCSFALFPIFISNALTRIDSINWRESLESDHKSPVTECPNMKDRGIVGNDHMWRRRMQCIADLYLRNVRLRLPATPVTLINNLLVPCDVV